MPTPGNNATPSYSFSSTRSGAINYGGDCSSATTTAVAGTNTVVFNALADGTHSNCVITVTDDVFGTNSLPLSVSSFTVDTTEPSLGENTPAPAIGNNPTPTYMFTSSEAGSIAYAGGCSSAAGAAVSGLNTISFTPLADGQYNACTVVVTDAVGNASAPLNISPFTIDTTSPVVTGVTSTNADGPYTTSDVIHIQINLSETVAVTGLPKLTLATGNPATTTVALLWPLAIPSISITPLALATAAAISITLV